MTMRNEYQQVMMEKMMFFNMQFETNAERRVPEKIGLGETNQFAGIGEKDGHHTGKPETATEWSPQGEKPKNRKRPSA